MESQIKTFRTLVQGTAYIPLCFIPAARAVEAERERETTTKTFSDFPPSFVLIFAREPSDATSITRAPFRFSTPLRPCRCIAVRHPCFDSTTEGGKTHFQTNESKHQHVGGQRSTSLTLRTANSRDSSSSNVANCP